MIALQLVPAPVSELFVFILPYFNKSPNPPDRFRVPTHERRCSCRALRLTRRPAAAHGRPPSGDKHLRVALPPPRVARGSPTANMRTPLGTSRSSASHMMSSPVNLPRSPPEDVEALAATVLDEVRAAHAGDRRRPPERVHALHESYESYSPSA